MDQQHPNDEGLGSFADIVSNLLGVLVVVLLLTTLFVATSGRPWPNTDKKSPQAPPFKIAERKMFLPWDDIFVVAHGRFWEWDRQETIKGFLANPGEKTIKLPVGQAVLSNESNWGDINTYSLLIEMDWEKFQKESPQWETIKTSLMNRISSYTGNGRSLTFLVFPTGLDVFSKLYPFLLESHVSFRFIAMRNDDPIKLYRDRYQFDAKTYQY